MKGFPDLPPIWWAGSIAIIYLGKWLAPSLNWQSGLSDAVSQFIFYGALAVIAWSAFWFWRRKTPIERIIANQ